MIDQMKESGDWSVRRSLLPMEEIDRILRTSAVRQEMVPMECRASWLVPVLVSGPHQQVHRLYLTGFLYPVMGLPNEPKRVLRPRFHWTIDPATGRIAEIVDCAYRDFASSIQSSEEVGVLTPDLLPATTIPELEHFRTDVLKAYDRALPFVFTSPTELALDAREAVAQLNQRLHRAIEPFLAPFYGALNPAFFKWLDQF
jgi:hypothetical protein